MSDKLKSLREQRGQVGAEMRALMDKASAEKRDLSNEELASHGAMFDKQEGLRLQIVAEERQVEVDRANAGRDIESQRSKGKTGGEERSMVDLQMTGFRSYLRGGMGALNGEGAEEFRALQAGNNVEGGYLIAPEQFVSSLIQAVDNAVFIRGRATKYRLTSSTSMGAPSLDTDMDDAEWTTELGTGSEDTALRFGKRELRPRPVAKRIKVSKTLLRVGALPIEQIIMQRLAYKFGITQEKAFLTGSGSGQPLGVFTASNDGIGTARDVSTGNTATAITFDGLIEAKFSVKSQYWPKADWLFHRDAVKQITKIKDGDGQYLWRQSVRDGEPDTLMGRPLMISEYAPNTFTTGLYAGLFGDFSHYWIADALDMQVQRLTELYAETNQDGFIGRLESDGAPVLAEAFARVKLG
jgi:HK97 family phage major capsid protein